MSTGQFDDGNPNNEMDAGMGFLGGGPLGPPSLTLPKVNWQNTYYALRTGGVNPSSVDQVIAQRAAEAAKAAGVSGLGEDSRIVTYARQASQVIARQRDEIQRLRARLGRAS